MSELDERRILAENLRELMNEKGISQQTLANAVGVSEASVSFWLSGRKYPTPGKVQKIADFFGVRKSRLIDKQAQPQTKTERIAAKLERLTEHQLDIVEQIIDNFS